MNTYNSVASGTVLQFFTEYLEEVSQKLNTITNDVSSIKQNNSIIGAKIDVLFDSLALGISSIKKEKRDEEEKLILIEDKIESTLESDDKLQSLTHSFEKILAIKINNWDKTDKNTKIFLISAEYLFSSLQKIRSPDYSPCIIQFSRALENELFIHVYKPFIDQVRQISNINELLINDLSNDKTKRFSQQIIAGSLERQLSFGDMIYILSKSGSLSYDSYIMKTFFEYLRKTFRHVIEKQFMNSLYLVNTELRRKAAHPDILDINKAELAKKIIPDDIDKLYNI